MRFVQCDDMIQHLAAAASDPSFGSPVGHRRQLHRIVMLAIRTSR
jgi:hypothetical protein